jgi:putative ABC transport system substrate-binding protein
VIERRTFVAGSLVLLVAPLAAEAQPAGKFPRIGVLAPGSPPSRSFDSFREGLRELGYVEGRTILIESRWDEGRPERNTALAGELVRLNVDIIVATTTALTAAAKATKEIPIVMTSASGDPVRLGLAASLPRPGGNVTGLMLQTYELPEKRLELLKEALPAWARSRAGARRR